MLFFIEFFWKLVINYTLNHGWKSIKLQLKIIEDFKHSKMVYGLIVKAIFSKY